jgi:hypothetical protein
MLVFGDARAHVIGFAIELALVLFGEVAVVFGHVFFLIVLEALFAAFETCGLSGREFSVLDAVGNAPLLVGLTAVDLIDSGMTGIDLSRAGAGSVVVLGLSGGGSDNHQAASRHDEKRVREFVCHTRENPCQRV